jgi:hypothetical protein
MWILLHHHEAIFDDWSAFPDLHRIVFNWLLESVGRKLRFLATATLASRRCELHLDRFT